MCSKFDEKTRCECWLLSAKEMGRFSRLGYHLQLLYLLQQRTGNWAFGARAVFYSLEYIKYESNFEI